MESDIQIKPGSEDKGDQLDGKSENRIEREMDFVVEGAGVGNEILQKLKRIKIAEEEGVIYGVYDSSHKGWGDRLNDFLIDRSKISVKDKSYFFHMLAVMVDAGIPVVKSVKSLAQRSGNPHFRRVLNTIGYSMERGAKFSEAMGRFEEVFNEAEVGIVKSGEATGRLNSMLFKLSEQLDKKHDLNSKLFGAAFYPIVVLSVLLLVSVGMLVWVFPTLLGLLQEGGIGSESLPLATRILIGLQTAVVDYWWAILLVIFSIYGLFKFYVSSEYGAVRWDLVKLKLPIAGELIRKVFVLRFVSTLGILIDAGLPVIAALKIAGGSISNRLYKLKAQEVINEVREGSKISASLKDAEFLFSPEVVQMMQVGEESASLAKVSEKVADQYQREVDNALKRLSSIFEPIMILIVGLFVGLLALAIMQPIFNLSSNVGF